MTAQEKQIKELIENGTKEDIHLGLTLLDVFQLEKNEFLNKYYHAIFLFLYTEFHDKYKSFADLSSEELIEELHYFFGTTELDLDYSDFPTLPEILPLLHKLKELYLCKVTINEQVIVVSTKKYLYEKKKRVFARSSLFYLSKNLVLF